MILTERQQIFLYKLLSHEWIPYELAELKYVLEDIESRLRKKYPNQTIDELARRVRAEYDVAYATQKRIDDKKREIDVKNYKRRVKRRLDTKKRK